MLGIYSWSKVSKLVKCYLIIVSFINCGVDLLFREFNLCQHTSCSFSPLRFKRSIMDLKMSYTCLEGYLTLYLREQLKSYPIQYVNTSHAIRTHRSCAH